MLSRHREPPNLTAGVFRLRFDVGSRQWGGGSYDLDFTTTPAMGALRWNVRVFVDDPTLPFDPLADYRLEIARVGRGLQAPYMKTAWLGKCKGNAQKLRAAFDELIALGHIVPGPTPKTFTLSP